MKVIYWCFSCVLIIGCQGEGQLADVPVFVQIPSVRFNGNVSGTANSHLISETWVYADSIFIGAFPVPAKIPVIAASDPISMQFFAGIRENGQANSPVIYPFYNVFHVSLPAEVLDQEVIPEFHYLSSTKLALIEGFENGNIFREDIDGDEATQIIPQLNELLDGKSGVVCLSASNPELEVASAFPIERLPTDGSAVFLELDYISDVALAVGLQGRSNSIPAVRFYKVVLFASAQRQKIYLNLTPDLQASDLESYQVIFRSSFDTELTQNKQYVYLDNIKLLHF